MKRCCNSDLHWVDNYFRWKPCHSSGFPRVSMLELSYCPQQDTKTQHQETMTALVPPRLTPPRLDGGLVVVVRLIIQAANTTSIFWTWHLAPGCWLLHPCEVWPGPHTRTGKAAAAGWGRSSWHRPEHPTNFRRRLRFGGNLFSRPGLGSGHVTTPAAAPRPWLPTRSCWPGLRAREAGTLAELWANRWNNLRWWAAGPAPPLYSGPLACTEHCTLYSHSAVPTHANVAPPLPRPQPLPSRHTTSCHYLCTYL